MFRAQPYKTKRQRRKRRKRSMSHREKRKQRVQMQSHVRPSVPNSNTAWYEQKHAHAKAWQARVYVNHSSNRQVGLKRFATDIGSLVWSLAVNLKEHSSMAFAGTRQRQLFNLSLSKVTDNKLASWRNLGFAFSDQDADSLEYAGNMGISPSIYQDDSNFGPAVKSRIRQSITFLRTEMNPPRQKPGNCCEDASCGICCVKIEGCSAQPLKRKQLSASCTAKSSQTTQVFRSVVRYFTHLNRPSRSTPACRKREIERGQMSLSTRLCYF
ncbi:hypothetical protein BCR37DRAFT_387844 [Protomyces lactucae-debilis]|uniref:Uncharacterized protein n=1 Tax=Protomyces lactucae-debilis TaxID=2754530 RepID=A0A1Y2FE82_PROLT|nr:uncharacterized protein BCR37DRAFT_387844 [Protomyces lactucae-debilis]ORY81616.1 hypothetical protein BCR37DRAFT_387844 [Protomyces lactucae-debilis]